MEVLQISRKLVMLLEMGFPEAEAQLALESCGGEVHQAAEWLMDRSGFTASQRFSSSGFGGGGFGQGPESNESDVSDVRNESDVSDVSDTEGAATESARLADEADATDAALAPHTPRLALWRRHELELVASSAPLIADHVASGAHVVGDYGISLTDDVLSSLGAMSLTRPQSKQRPGSTNPFNTSRKSARRALAHCPLVCDSPHACSLAPATSSHAHTPSTPCTLTLISTVQRARCTHTAQSTTATGARSRATSTTPTARSGLTARSTPSTRLRWVRKLPRPHARSHTVELNLSPPCRGLATPSTAWGL